MAANEHMVYLLGYPEHLSAPVAQMIADDRLAAWLRQRHPQAHEVRSDRALYDYVEELKSDHLRNAPPLARVAYDGKLQSVRNALGTHTRIARVQGGKLKSKREIHIASVFREAPAAFLRMIAAHEVAHLKEPEHDKAFYQLCTYIERDYAQLEFETRAWLCLLAAGQENPWA